MHFTDSMSIRNTRQCMLYGVELDVGWETQPSLVRCCWPCFHAFMHTPLPQLSSAYNQFSRADQEVISEQVIGILDSGFFLIGSFCDVLCYSEVSQAAGLNQATKLEDQWQLRGNGSFPRTPFYSHKVNVLKISKYQQGKYMFLRWFIEELSCPVALSKTRESISSFLLRVSTL